LAGNSGNYVLYVFSFAFWVFFFFLVFICSTQNFPGGMLLHSGTSRSPTPPPLRTGHTVQ
jgi:hypothetical protein